MITQELIKTQANKMLGKPYVWGGESDEEGGYDCSGFIYSLLNQCGYRIGRTTAQGYYNYFSKYTTVQKNNVDCGDLIFFGSSTKKVTHIAIAKDLNSMYESIGNSKNTIKNPGKGIVVSPINRRKDIVAIKRFIYSKEEYYPIYTGNSLKIDVVFKTIGAPSGSVSKRLPVATVNNITNYKGTATQNLKLISLAKQGKLIKA